MRVFAVFRKGLHEQLREPWLLVLIVIMAPFFIVLMSLVFGAGTYSYKLAVVNHDQPVALPNGGEYRGGQELLQALIVARSQSGAPALAVQTLARRELAEVMLKNGKAHAMIVIPEGFSSALYRTRRHEQTKPERLIYMGDMASTNYMITAVLAINVVASYIEKASEQPSAITLVEEGLGGSAGRSELDLAIPGMFVLAIIMLLFPVAMSLARESENGCLKRLQLTKVSALELLGGVSLVQVLVGIVAILLAFATASAMGFRSQGPLVAAIAIGIVGSFAVIGVGLLVACFSRSVTEAFLIGNFPMMLLMFFSGAMIPIPKVPLITIGATTVGLWDWLPTTHAVGALNKVLGLGVGFSDVLYEIISLVVLSALYFAAGVWLFRRRRMAAS